MGGWKPESTLAVEGKERSGSEGEAELAKRATPGEGRAAKGQEGLPRGRLGWRMGGWSLAPEG